MAKHKKQKIKKPEPIVIPPRKVDRKVCPVCGSHAIDYYLNDRGLDYYNDELILLAPGEDSVSLWGICDDCNSSWDLTLALDDGLITNVAWGDGDVYTNKSHIAPNSTRRKSNEFAFIPDSTPLYYETLVVDDAEEVITELITKDKKGDN